MPNVSTGLTCDAIRKFGGFDTECCPVCHQAPVQEHQLIFTPLTRLGTENYGYVCCTMRRACRYWKSKPSVGPKKPAYVPTVYGELCPDAECPACAESIHHYWSHMLQRWVRYHDQYEALNPHYGMDRVHPYSMGHTCAPEAVQTDYEMFVPEFRAFLCEVSPGKPTFGIKYCANPIYACVVINPTRIILHLPYGDKLTSWIPKQFVNYVAQVIDLGPPF